MSNLNDDHGEGTYEGVRRRTENERWESFLNEASGARRGCSHHLIALATAFVAMIHLHPSADMCVLRRPPFRAVMAVMAYEPLNQGYSTPEEPRPTVGTCILTRYTSAGIVAR